MRFIPIKAVVAVAILGIVAAPSLAADTPDTAPAATPAPDVSADSTVRLSPDQREAALEYGATRALREPPINGLDRKIHGEMGMEIGSNGSHALYGTATVPLGESSSATISFLTADSGHYRYRY